MMRAEDTAKLRANQRFLVQEMERRGIEVTLLDYENELLEARLGNHSEILFDIDSSVMPYVSAVVAGSKSITRKLLERAGIAVPRGERFPSENVQAILDFAAGSLGFPVVLKPSVGMQGKDVHTGIQHEDELRAALISVEESRGACEVLVEEHFSAREYRFFVTRNGGYAALHRDPAHVIGNGIDTIEVLAARESDRRLNPRVNCLGAIVLDDEASRYLRQRGLCFLSVPGNGEKVYVRGSSNVMMGGVPADVTDSVHPDFVQIALRSLAALNNLPYGGIDIMARDISQAPGADSYRVLEVNSVPGLGMHMAPGKGKRRNVAALIVDMIFPETSLQNGLRRRDLLAA